MTKPALASFNAIIATIGEISITPSGGITLRNGSKYGSQMRAKKSPTADSLAPGNQVRRM